MAGRLLSRRSEKAGLAPGTAAYVGERKVDEVRAGFVHYSGAAYEVKDGAGIDDCLRAVGRPGVVWINVEGLHDTALMERLQRGLGVHPLVIEDALNTRQHPKLDVYDDYLFIVLKMLAYDDGSRTLDIEQVSIIVGRGYVVTFQEGRPGDVFGPVRTRLANDKGRIRRMGPDYLAHALMDSVVDNYFGVIERLDEDVEALEDELLATPGPGSIRAIHALKRELVYLRRSVWPLREIVGALTRDDTQLIAEPTRVYFRDLHDHTVQVIEMVETSRDLIAGMLDIYLSSVSNRLNEIMKVLTIYAVIFIPLTFIAGVYGMNFEFMPEVHWRWGYFGALGLMAAVGAGMLVYFRRKRWI